MHQGSRTAPEHKSVFFHSSVVTEKADSGV